MNYGRLDANFLNYEGNIFLLAPIPIVYKKINNVERLNKKLKKIAESIFTPAVLDVPDERHISDLGDPITFNDDVWKESQKPAIGIWHRVQTNNFLDINENSVKKLRNIIEEEYLEALKITANLTDIEPYISESWIQFYRDGDRKILHNHERYGPPYPHERWAGSYYIDDGNPTPEMPYSGVFSFRVRDYNYYIKPQSGLLLLFPADILHEVHPFYGQTRRVVINFNINAKYKSE